MLVQKCAFGYHKLQAKAIQYLYQCPKHYSDACVSVPTPPQNVVIGSNTATTLEVQWDPPSQMNGIFEHYDVTYTGPDGSETTATAGEQTTLTGLEPESTYTVSVTATNGRGTSEPSEPVTGETLSTGEGNHANG